jgi:hypothetical protein
MLRRRCNGSPDAPPGPESLGTVNIGDAGFGDRWLVCGTHGEHELRAEGRIQAEAWHRAFKLAEAAGLLASRCPAGPPA